MVNKNICRALKSKKNSTQGVEYPHVSLFLLSTEYKAYPQVSCSNRFFEKRG